MSLKEKLKKNKTVMNLYSFYTKVVYGTATIISPKLNTKMHYRQVYGRKINLENPQTFSEKLLWLKLNKYNNNPLVIRCADKYAVRQYIEDCGCSEILNDLIGVWNKAEDIPWDDLPEKFVLKWNFGAGMNIICDDKSKLDKDATIKKLKKWGKCKYWLLHSEMQYKYAPKKIIGEKFLSNDTETVIADYKVYCFHGEPQAIFVMNGRGYNLTTEFFDINWNALENTQKYKETKIATEKPKCLAQMMDVACKLSHPFPFVRLDFYVVKDNLYFGEMTFTPAGGLYTSTTKIHEKDMAELINLEIC